MFERRLKIMLVVLGVPVAIVIGRLAELQVFEVRQHRVAAEEMLELEPRFFPFLRGEIVDRHGVRLAYNAEMWELGVHYMAMVNDRGDISARRVFRDWGYEMDERLTAGIADSWRAIASLTRVPLEELQASADDRVRRIQRMKRYLAEANGVEDMEILEEYQYWPVVRGLNFDEQVEARIRFAEYPWIRVVPSQERRYRGGEAIGPIIGRLGEVPPGVAESSQAEDDMLSRYQPGDLMGISGCEALGESWLRGRRGFEHLTRSGKVIREIHEPAEPVNGRTMKLTLDLALQQRIYNRLAAAVDQYQPYSTGASMVLIHVPTREVRALVSYPSFDPNLSWTDMLTLQEDKRRRPLSFRAAGGHYYYAPGSSVKPMILASAMAANVTGLGTRYDCYGRMFVDYPDVWRCEGYHPNIDPMTAVKKSCNVFFYHVGQRMGIDGLDHWLSLFGLGRPTGMRLPEEKGGRLPSTRKPGIARLAAIGQGELDVTPVQIANTMADMASGEHRETLLWADDPVPRRSRRLPISPEIRRYVREAMYKASNEPGGTAYEALQPVREKIAPLAILGKTGSAEATGFEVGRRYTCEMADGTLQTFDAPDRRTLLEEHPDIRAVRSWRILRFPSIDEPPTHAWFAGYITDRRNYQQDIRGGDMSYAFACVIEFAGHGGEVAAPVVGKIVLDLLDLHQRENPSGVAAREGRQP